LLLVAAGAFFWLVLSVVVVVVVSSEDLTASEAVESPAAFQWMSPLALRAFQTVISTGVGTHRCGRRHMFWLGVGNNML
jgi:hypothetical protein